MKYAIIENGIVTNIAVGLRPLTANWAAIPTGCPAAVGDRYENGCFYAPEGSLRMMPETAQVVAALEAMLGGVADA